MAMLPAQSVELWHFTQRVFTMSVNTLGVPGLAACGTGAVSGDRARQARGAQAPANISTDLDNAPLLRIPPPKSAVAGAALCGRSGSRHQRNESRKPQLWTLQRPRDPAWHELHGARHQTPGLPNQLGFGAPGPAGA